MGIFYTIFTKCQGINALRAGCEALPGRECEALELSHGGLEGSLNLIGKHGNKFPTPKKTFATATFNGERDFGWEYNR